MAEHNHNHDEQNTYVIEHSCCAHCAAKLEKKSGGKEKDLWTEQKKDMIVLGIAAVLFVLAILLEDVARIISIASFVVAYLLLGGKILKEAGGNLFKGHVFDENFLMSIATLAAFAIGDFAEAVGVMLFFRIGELFEDMAVEKSRNQIMEAVDLRPETVQLVHDHGNHIIPAKQAKVGDILLVRVGNRIPLDAIVVEGESRIDTAPVTGEPVPVKVTEGDSVISGCINTSGVLKIRVEKTLEDSMVTRILNSVEHAAASKPKIDRFITRFARVYTPFVVALAVATAIIPSLISGDWEKWIYTAITFLVISCPCALVLSVPLAFFSGIGAASKKGILFKGGLAIEALRQVKAVVMDKTGTITKGTFEVQRCVPVGTGCEEEVLALAAVCESQSTHPIAASILKEAAHRQLQVEQPEALEEIAGKGIRAMTSKGEVLCGNRALLEMYHIEVPQQEDKGYGTEVLVACQGTMVGYIVISDSLKEDSKSAISGLKARGIKTVMLTGDAKQSADVIAKETGIEEVYAKLLPEDKLNRLQQVRGKYGEVMFVGDGINDAPVLAGADVGAAMGNGADAAIEAADVVFMTSSMQAIPQALEIAKTTNTIAIQNVIFALAIKALVMVLGLLGFANMWMAVFADSGVAMLCVLNAIRILRRK